MPKFFKLFEPVGVVIKFQPIGICQLLFFFPICLCLVQFVKPESVGLKLFIFGISIGVELQLLAITFDQPFVFILKAQKNPLASLSRIIHSCHLRFAYLPAIPCPVTILPTSDTLTFNCLLTHSLSHHIPQ